MSAEKVTPDLDVSTDGTIIIIEQGEQQMNNQFRACYHTVGDTNDMDVHYHPFTNLVDAQWQVGLLKSMGYVAWVENEEHERVEEQK